MDINSFNVVDESVTTEEIDNEIKYLVELRATYERFNAESKQANADFKAQEAKVIDLLQRVNKDKYHVKEVGSVSIRERLSVQTPKSLEEKQAFKNWLVKQYGEEGATSLLSVNAAKLNSIYKEEFARAVDEGRADEFAIDGIGEPVARYSLSVRKN